MAPRVLSSSLRGIFTGKQAYASQAVARKVETETIALPKQELKSTTLPNGLIVSSVESYSPISQIGVFLKAGPRYETPNKLGVAHALRNAAGLTTKNASAFGITRHLEYVGSNMSAACDKENLSFQVQFNRDHLDKSIDILAEVVLSSEFRPWELSDIAPRMKLDVAELKQRPFALLLEKLHRAAYRGGLAHSLYSPKFMIGKHSQKMLKDYVSETFSTGRASVVGLGIDHTVLLDYVARAFHLPSGIGISDGVTKYQGGEEFFDYGTELTYVAIAAEGPGLKNQKDVLALALLQQLLGTGSHSKYADAHGKLGQVAAKNTLHPFAVSGLNINHSDTGLFGFCLAGHPDDMTKLVKGMVNQMREMSKAAPSAKDLAIAKHKLKARIYMATESPSSLMEEIGVQTLSTGHFSSPADLEKVIDAITAQEIANVSAKVVKGKPSMAALGRLHATPHLEELV